MSEAPIPWQEVHARLRPFVARRVSEHDVDDVTQDVMLRLVRAGHQLRDEEAVAGWAARAARNAITDHYRKRATERRLEDAVRHEPDSDSQDEPSARDVRAEMATWIGLFVELLPESYREPVRLAELEGLTQAEIATRLGLSASGARTRVQRGRKKLRELVEACCVVEQDARGQLVDYYPRNGCDC